MSTGYDAFLRGRRAHPDWTGIDPAGGDRCGAGVIRRRALGVISVWCQGADWADVRAVPGRALGVTFARCRAAHPPRRSAREDERMLDATIPATAPPLPGRAVIRQRWSDFLFLHWRVDPAEVAPMLPPGTRPDVHDGSAWVGLIPFVLSDHAFLPLPPVPGLGTFIEINVRTYSIDERGRRGVVFRSLDAEQLPSVLAARALFGLPYEWMQAGIRQVDDTVEYRSRRRTGSRPGTRIHARPGAESVDTELNRFLTARWGFHERHLGRTIYARNTHAPWPLVEAELLHLDDQLLAAAGFPDLAARTPDSVLATPLGHPGVITEFAAARAISRPAG